MHPAIMLINRASIRNCIRISFLNAQRAFLMPISLVRSVTETSIIFITPMPPTISDIAATPQRNRVSVPVTDEIEDKISESVLKE